MADYKPGGFTWSMMKDWCRFVENQLVRFQNQEQFDRFTCCIGGQNRVVDKRIYTDELLKQVSLGTKAEADHNPTDY